MMQRKRLLLSHFLIMTLCSVFLLAGCSLYRPDLSQGNHITQEDLDRLRPNLSKHQVQDIMGSPAIDPAFALEQWNYTYAYVDGLHRDQPLKFKTISLYFKQDKLQGYNSHYWHPANLPQVSTNGK